ncbi:TPD1 protein [Ananas comosus]|uniref:TPD1 protein n=1 Tax=Ananas comosus TaxID=4615 RepID=A0A199UQX7_ANACO|nr:TPD1 protein [Ananas comosus]
MRFSSAQGSRYGCTWGPLGDLVRTVTTPHDACGRNDPTGRERAREAEETDRIGEGCSKDDIVVYQGATAPLPSGIPTYTVEVLNVCARGCAIEGIHLRCGWFSSARLINPRLFRRLRFDDCLLNDGRPLPNGASLSFQYANSFPYPLSVSSASCLPSS